MGNPGWAQEEKFATDQSRKENEDALDKNIGQWTKDHTPEKVMTMLQEQRVPVGIVETAEDLFNDPQIKHRQQFRLVDHPVIGPYSCQAPAYMLSETPCNIDRPAPCLGEHNEAVYKEVLGFSDDEIADMLVEGLITTEADVPTNL